MSRETVPNKTTFLGIFKQWTTETEKKRHLSKKDQCKADVGLPHDMNHSLGICMHASNPGFRIQQYVGNHYILVHVCFLNVFYTRTDWGDDFFRLNWSKYSDPLVEFQVAKSSLHKFIDTTQEGCGRVLA